MGRFLVFIAALLLAFTTHVHADDLPIAKPEEVGLSAIKLEQVGKSMRQRVRDDKIAGAVVAIARDGKVIFFEAYGKRDKAASKPMEKNTIFRLYSMSKAITTAAVMMLVDEGKIAVEDPASKYVPALSNVKVQTEVGLVAPERAITVADLMRHTSGFADIKNTELFEDAKMNEAQDLEDYVNRLVSVPLVAHPGHKWVYGHSIDVLGLIVQEVSNQPLDDFLKECFFDPLEMVDTGFYLPEEKQGRLAVFYERPQEGSGPSKERLVAVDLPIVNDKYFKKPDAPLGGTGLVGTTEDYMRFLLMIANGGEWKGERYLSEEAIRQMTTDQLPPRAFPLPFSNPYSKEETVRDGIGFGFGFSVCTAKSIWAKDARVGEYSWGGAASTHYWVSPNNNALIVVTMEQVYPVNRDTRLALKPIIYDAIRSR